MNFNCVLSCETRRLPYIFLVKCIWSASSNLRLGLFKGIMERWSVWCGLLQVSSDIRVTRSRKPVCQSLRIVGRRCACCGNTTLPWRLVIELLATTHQLFISCIECINCVMVITASFGSWSRKWNFIDLFRSDISLDSTWFKFLNYFCSLSFRITASDHYLSFSSAKTSNVIFLSIQLYHMMILEESSLELYVI